jgi:hypothetical protein
VTKIEIVQLFAVFHDARRINESVDDRHGRRGADLAVELRGRLFDLPDADFNLSTKPAPNTRMG